MPTLQNVQQSWDHPPWELTPEFNIINHLRTARELIPQYVPNVSLIWNSSNHDCWDSDADSIDESTVKTRDDYVYAVAAALNEACLTPLADEASDADLAAAVHAIAISTNSAPVVLPGPTAATITALSKAGFDSLNHLLDHLTYGAKVNVN